MANRVTQRSVAIVLLACSLATVGCGMGKLEGWRLADWDVRRSIGWKKDKPDPEVPQRLVATWSDSILNTTGQPSKRGFGGRLIFFKEGSEDPVRVDGQLVVYAFDETERPAHETQPTRRYVFPVEQFAKHESNSALGASYSVWLPWDDVGGPRRKISLIARFEPKKGGVVIGEQTRHYLPGVEIDGMPETQFADTAVARTTSEVKLAGYQGDGLGGAANTAEQNSVLTQTPMSTATIPLPQRIAAGSQSLDGATVGKLPAEQSSTSFAPAKSPVPATPAAQRAPGRGAY